MDTGILTIYREHKGGRINYKKEYNTNKLLPWGKKTRWQIKLHEYIIHKLNLQKRKQMLSDNRQ